MKGFLLAAEAEPGKDHWMLPFAGIAKRRRSPLFDEDVMKASSLSKLLALHRTCRQWWQFQGVVQRISP
jgi:hypothetical protein